jgi:hypothetical protein
MQFEDIQGWFDYYQLYDRYFEFLQDGMSFAEVGIWRGKSFIYLAKKIKESGKKVKMYAVDHWISSDEWLKANEPNGEVVYQEFLQNLKDNGVDDITTVIRADSVKAVKQIKGKLDAIFIDADHSYEGVYRDVEAWHAKLKPVNMYGGHDYNNLDFAVKRAVDDFAKTVGKTVTGHSDSNTSQQCWLMS